MKKQITSISILPSAKISAIIMFAMSLIFVIPFSIMFLALPSQNTPKAFGFIFPFLPFVYAFFGFLFTALACFVYNVIAKRFGGIELTMIDK